MTTRSAWRRSLTATVIVTGAIAAVILAWFIGFRSWADGRTPGDLGDENRHDDPTLAMEWFVKGATVGLAYAFVTFTLICAAITAVVLVRRRRDHVGAEPEPDAELLWPPTAERHPTDAEHNP
jgi:hypothetical protein